MFNDSNSLYKHLTKQMHYTDDKNLKTDLDINRKLIQAIAKNKNFALELLKKPKKGVKLYKTVNLKD